MHSLVQGFAGQLTEEDDEAQASPPKRWIRLSMYFSTSFSNSPCTTGTTIIFIRPGSGTSISPWMASVRPVDFLLSTIFQWPPTSALPTPLTGVHFTVPLVLSLTYLLAYTVWMLTCAVPTFSISHW